jgi:hypothetical protein
MYISVVIFI